MPCDSSPLVERLAAAHGVVIGKTRMHELAEGVTSINVHGGPVLNPYGNTMHVGGGFWLPDLPCCFQELLRPPVSPDSDCMLVGVLPLGSSAAASNLAVLFVRVRPAR
jgi:hypothetical protein